MRSIFVVFFFLLTMTLSACGTSEGSTDPEKGNVVHAARDDKQVIGNKAWKDLTQTNLVNEDDPISVKGWVTERLLAFDNPPGEDSKLIQSGHDVYFYYYMEAMSVQKALDKVIEVEGASLEKDFDNLHLLIKVIIEEHKKRTEHLDYEDYKENKREALKDWKDPSKRMKKAVVYTQQLLNDLHAITSESDRKTFGLTYQLDGEKINELEEFINKE